MPPAGGGGGSIVMGPLETTFTVRNALGGGGGQAWQTPQQTPRGEMEEEEEDGRLAGFEGALREKEGGGGTTMAVLPIPQPPASSRPESRGVETMKQQLPPSTGHVEHFPTLDTIGAGYSSLEEGYSSLEEAKDEDPTPPPQRQQPQPPPPPPPQQPPSQPEPPDSPLMDELDGVMTMEEEAAKLREAYAGAQGYHYEAPAAAPAAAASLSAAADEDDGAGTVCVSTVGDKSTQTYSSVI